MIETIKISETLNRKVIIYVDKNEANDILPFLFSSESNFGTFYLFKNLVFENRRNREIYKKEKITIKCNNLYAIRFDSDRNQNDRIYCLEFHEGKRRIVLSKLFKNKRTQKIDKKIKAKLESICTRTYKF